MCLLAAERHLRSTRADSKAADKLRISLTEARRHGARAPNRGGAIREANKREPFADRAIEV
jgi:hypothetical protein